MARTSDLNRVRILNYRLVPPEDLLAHPSNPRRHPAAQRDALRASLRALGWVAPILVNVQTQHVLDGHARVEEALSAHVPQVPVLEVDLPPEDEPLFLSVYDPITALASYDQEQLAILLEDVQTDEAALQSLLSDLAVRAGVIPPDDPLAEWQGMPEFAQEDEESFDAIKVHFANADDRAAFLRLMDEDPERRKSIWYPKREYEKQDG